MSKYLKFCSVAIIVLTANAQLAAQTAKSKADAILREMGGEAIRTVDTDICLPATAEEYEALGKNAILMLESSSAISTELPLRRVYAIHKGVRLPLHRIITMEKTEDESGSQSRQVSFYLLPIQLMKSNAKVEVDFTGERTGFGILTFTEEDGLDEGAPAFARLDEYNDPSDPDPTAVADILAREYPAYVK